MLRTISLTINREFCFYQEERYGWFIILSTKTKRHSSLFRVTQYRYSTRANNREKTGMTAASVVCNKRR